LTIYGRLVITFEFIYFRFNTFSRKKKELGFDA